MKLFKKLAILCATLSLCVGFAAFASCGSNADSSSDNPTESSTPSTDETTKVNPDDVIPVPDGAAGYYFKVINADGTPAKDVKVQLCVGLDLCYTPVAVDANGDVYYAPNGFPGAGVYDVHVLGGEWGDEQMSFDGVTQTPDAYPANYIILALK